MELPTKISIYQWFKLFTEDDSICKMARKKKTSYWHLGGLGSGDLFAVCGN